MLIVGQCYADSMNGEMLQSAEQRKYSITNMEKIFLLFAYSPEEIYVKHSAQLHGAFQEICKDYPNIFNDISFGPYGGVVHSEVLDTAISAMMFNGYLQKRYGEGTFYEIDTSDLQAFGATMEEKLHVAGLPPFHKWQEIGERFGNLVAEYRFRPVEDMLVL